MFQCKKKKKKKKKASMIIQKESWWLCIIPSGSLALLRCSLDKLEHNKGKPTHLVKW